MLGLMERFGLTVTVILGDQEQHEMAPEEPRASYCARHLPSNV
jgi:hypothetical protein